MFTTSDNLTVHANGHSEISTLQNENLLTEVPTRQLQEKIETAAFVGYDPTIVNEEKLSPAALEVRNMVKEVFYGKGKTIDSIKKCIELLNKDPEVLGSSWLLQMNKIRFLAMLGIMDEANDQLRRVGKEYWNDLNARSHYWEIKAWFEELKMDRKFKRIHPSLLAKQKHYLEKGLECNPNNHAILMSRFVVAAIEQDAGAVVRFLERAIKVNERLAFDTVSEIRKDNSHLIKKARRLSPLAAKELDRIDSIYGQPRAGCYKRPNWLIVLAFVSVLGFSALNQNGNRNDAQVSVAGTNVGQTVNNSLFEENFAQPAGLIADGTNVGKTISTQIHAAFGTNVGLGRFVAGTNVGEWQNSPMQGTSVDQENFVAGTNVGKRHNSSTCGTNVG